MKKIIRAFLSFTLSISVLSCIASLPIDAYAESQTLAIDGVSIVDKSQAISVDDPVISGNTINSSIIFNQLNDYVTFELAIKNNSNNLFKITSITDDNASEYISTVYGYDDNYISGGDITTATIKLAYTKQLINQNLSLDSPNIIIHYESESGDTGEILFVPNTGFYTNAGRGLAVGNIVATVVFVALLGAGLVLIVRKKTRGAKLGVVFLISATLLIPLAAFAEEKFELSFKFDKVEILGDFEEFDVLVDPGDGSEPTTRKVTYGESIGELNAAEIEGYDFDKWVDGEGNEVTPETIVTSKMNIVAKYIAKTYTISYALSDGALQDGRTNPESYTVESNSITLANPERLGYTFAGWTGSNGSEPEINVTIPAGSTGDKSYTANFVANTDTKYTVINAYKSLDWYYEEDEPITYYGTTDSVVEAPQTVKYGFVAPEVQTVMIKADGTAEVRYEYERASFNFSVTNRDDVEYNCWWGYRCSDDGSYPYETTIRVKAKTRTGYHITWSDGSTDYEREFPLTEDTTMSFVYEPNHYTVKYDKGADDATGEMADQEFVYDEEQMLHSNEFTRTGYTFGGWGHPTYPNGWHIAAEDWTTKNLTDEDGGTYTFYASWRPVKVRVEYYDAEHSRSYWINEDHFYDEKIPMIPYEPRADHYDFVGYYADAEYTTPVDFENTIMKGDTMVYVKLAPQTYTLSFNTDGGTGIASENVTYGDQITRPADPVKEHYDFAGWYTDDTFATEFDFNSLLTEDKTIYAKYTPSVYTVNFRVDDTILDTRNIVYPGKVARPEDDPAKEHYTFVGWFTDDTYETEFDFASTEITSDITIYGKFRANSYTVNFNTDGGSEIAPRTIEYQGKVTRPDMDPTKDAYRFDGWFTDDTFATEFDFDNTEIEQDTTIYAKFTLITYTVTFNTDGGSSIDAQTIAYNQYATRPAGNPSKGSLAFYDWFADEDKTIRFDFANTKITSDTTIYAKYKTSFADDDWETIKNSLVLDPNFYPVGSEKNIPLDMDNIGANKYYTVRLANTSTPEVCNNEGYSQTACGIVIEFVDLVSSAKMKNSGNSNIGGWDQTDLITWLNEDFYNKLPAGLRDVIIPTYPIVTGGGNPDYWKNTLTDADYEKNKIYLPSGREINLELGDGDHAQDVNVDTRTYDYYASHTEASDRIKQASNEVAGVWWLRTPTGDESGKFFAVNKYGNSTRATVTNESWVAPTFRIGNAPEFTISFDTDGGNEIASQKVKYGEQATRPDEAPTKDGTQFENWYTDAEHTQLFNFDTIILEDKTIYANYQDQFGMDSWETIKTNLTANSNYYAIGSTKQVEIDIDDDGTPEQYRVRLANTSTPEKCNEEGFSQTACGIVLEFVDIVTERQMDSAKSADGGWKETDMANWLNGEFYNKLPSDLRNVVIATSPIVSGNSHEFSSDDITSVDNNKNKLYFLTATEINSESDLAGWDNKTGKTRTLDYYSKYTSREKKIKYQLNGASTDWWLRTADYMSGIKYLFVADSGFIYTGDADFVKGVAPAFRILSYNE